MGYKERALKKVVRDQYSPRNKCDKDQKDGSDGRQG